MGEEGRGCWELQQLRDLSNVILIGTGSKTLSTNIGFVGCNNEIVIEYLKYYSTAYMFTNAINPVQAATSLANLRILRSELGKQLRRKVMENYNYLRAKLEAKGYKIYGNPCPILPLYVGNEVVCRLVSRIMMDLGVHVNGIEYPVVKMGQARLRVNLMPQHTKEHLDTFVEVFEKSLAKSNIIFEKEMKIYMEKQ
jgi:glycine C-acetyltransferase